MALSNEINLRPRFNIELNKSFNSVLFAFLNNQNTDYKVKFIGEEIFIEIPEKEQYLWSPQLHIKINKIDENRSRLQGFFGQKSPVWSFFVFLHFWVAVVFVLFVLWTGLNWSMNKPISFQLQGIAIILIIWFIVYYIGKIGKAKGRKQMNELYNFMEKTIVKG
ncbi:GTP-binding protein [Abyssalbus ytuae]|uniref:GTP-binding protein n=1 Tax=Abyssalbus ytuae TaxID=2926907 RepID=A0A9E7CUK0_9FLAO|nr:GTP-binding protein [Abyssalbus ytuae]UOB18567.1 GTP-binding protein [Abyssalbus ytuae]